MSGSKLKRDKAKLAKSFKENGINVRGAYKAFSQTTKDLYNTPAITRVLEYLDSLGVYGKENDDTYGPDIITYSGFQPLAYIEVEVVTRWAGKSFPWSHVHILSRKRKYLELGLPISFYRLNSQMTHAVVVQDIVITEDRLEEVGNSMIASGEMMYRIPLDQCEVIEL